MADNSININGNVSGVQIQQGTYNSTQMQENNNINDADVEKYQAILDNINKYQEHFGSEFGERTDELISALAQAQEALNAKNAPMWKKAIGFVRDLAVEVSGGLIASGILALIAPIL